MSGNTEATLRLGFFVGVLLTMALWEAASPRRMLTVRRGPRWVSNLGLAAFNMLLARLLLPITAVGMAIVAESSNLGLMHLVAWPAWGKMTLSIVALDAAVYFQHVIFHAVPTLWRLHQVHHADLDFDVSTGVRFHTLEILLSALFKLALVMAIGPSPAAVVIFEILLNATAMLNHSNVYLPIWLDTILRWVIVTPDMHRVHHSVIRREANSNFGFNVPWWDFLLGTYCPQPAGGHEQMSIGISHLRDEHQVDRLPGMLALPFRVGVAPEYLEGNEDAGEDAKSVHR